MTNNPARAMRSWGDLNHAMNMLVHEGVIESFRTNREAKNAHPAIVVSIRSDVRETYVLRIVHDSLTGVFADAIVSVETID